jgi:copper chaperone NosL
VRNFSKEAGVNFASRVRFFCLVVGVAILSGCDEKVVQPEPVGLTREASGHYCQMIIVDHPGPKAQVFEVGRSEPLWFSSVRDALFYLKLPGEAQRVSATYVHDMGKASSWERPQDDGIWIEAAAAIYVIGSSRRGGMGAPETVPFAQKSEAETFARRFGGSVVAFDDIPTDDVLGDAGDQASSAKQTRWPEDKGLGSRSMRSEDASR